MKEDEKKTSDPGLQSSGEVLQEVKEVVTENVVPLKKKRKTRRTKKYQKQQEQPRTAINNQD